LVRGTIHDAAFPAGYFDAVLLQDTIEHVLNPREVMEEAHRVLRPGGAIILSTPNLDSLGRRLFATSWALMNPLEHLHLFNMRALHRLIEVAGLASQQIESDAHVNPDFFHGERTMHVRAAQWLIGRANRPAIQPILYKLSFGDKLNAIVVKPD
jgi:2-polyprenyl-3-methyl-5-hydroxy-6-metoxy-1,4-benzoquinol methylase